MTRMPVYFLSHGGGPWPYVEGMRQQFAKTEHEFIALPGRLPAKPKAVLVITGHWEEEEFTVSTAERPPMVYDYYGFPEHTYYIQYPASGSPELASRVKKLLLNAGISAKEDSARGFDHGDLPPYFSASINLVKSVFEKESGLEEAIYRRTDHRVFEASRSRHFGQRAMP